MQAFMETGFDIFYLTTVLTLGVLMVKRRHESPLYLLSGIMAIVLGAGDAFHLVPRAYALLTDGLAKHTAALGVGKFITSLTMTGFYVLLYHVWRARYRVRGRRGLSAAVYALAAARIALCLMPQNAWTSPTPPLLWGVLRNIPFALMGALMIVLFNRSVREHQDHAFRHMGLTILLSFAFYLPVVLWADRYPAVGILMIPKTLAYVWTTLICYRAGRETKRAQLQAS